MNGNLLRTIRALSGLTIYEFAAECGISKTQLQRYENGLTPIPCAVAFRIEAVFGLADEDNWRIVWSAAVAWRDAENVIKEAIRGSSSYRRTYPKSMTS